MAGQVLYSEGELVLSDGRPLDRLLQTPDFYDAIVRSSAAAVVPLTVAGFADQSAALQEWQNPLGTTKAWVGTDGGYSAPAGTLAASHLRATSQVKADYEMVAGAAASAGAAPGGLGVFAWAASVIPIVAQGAAAQSADLQQWKNSAGGNVALVDASGNGFFQHVSGTRADVPEIRAYDAGVGLTVGATGGKLAFHGAAPVVKPTGVAVDAAGIHAALVTLGLIAA